MDAPSPPPPSNHTVRTVVFDLDNTLVDTLAVIVDAFNVVAVPVKGRPLTAAEVVSYFGPTEENCLRAVLGRPDIDEDLRQFREHYAEGLREVSLYPGIALLLERLRQAGRPLALCTGKGRWTTRVTLEALGLDSLFSVIMTGDDVSRNKPHPDPLYKIAEATDCLPRNLVMVGDALADVRAARAAGARGLLVLWGHPDSRPGHDQLARQEAHAVLDTVTDLDRWFVDQGLYSG